MMRTALRQRLWDLTNGGCFYCHIELLDDEFGGTFHGEKMQKEHKIPRSRGGSDERENLVPSCARCNSEKGTKTVDEFRDWKILVGDHSSFFGDRL